jgi:phage gp36-like protein
VAREPARPFHPSPFTLHPLPNYTTYAALPGPITPADVVKALDDNADGVADTAAIAQVLDAADEQIDGYLACKYALPLATVPPLVTSLASTLCRYALYARRGTPPENNPFAEQQKQAIKTLEKLAEGRLLLYPVITPAAGVSGSVISEDSRL